MLLVASQREPVYRTVRSPNSDNNSDADFSGAMVVAETQVYWIGLASFGSGACHGADGICHFMWAGKG